MLFLYCKRLSFDQKKKIIVFLLFLLHTWRSPSARQSHRCPMTGRPHMNEHVLVFLSCNPKQRRAKFKQKVQSGHIPVMGYPWSCLWRSLHCFRCRTSLFSGAHAPKTNTSSEMRFWTEDRVRGHVSCRGRGRGRGGVARGQGGKGCTDSMWLHGQLVSWQSATKRTHLRRRSICLFVCLSLFCFSNKNKQHISSEQYRR